VSATATLAHPDRLTARPRARADSAADVELAVRHLVWLIAGRDGDEATALEAIGRATARLSAQRREVNLDEDRPVGCAGVWSLENGMLPNIVLGES
jgi:hypothetical protein